MSSHTCCLSNGPGLGIQQTLSYILEDSSQHTISDDTLNSIYKVKYEYNHILGEQVGNYTSKLKQKHFELNEKANKLLARQLSLLTRQLLNDHKQINDRFF